MAGEAVTLPSVGTLLLKSAVVIGIANTAGFMITAVTKSHKITDLTGTMAFPASAWSTHIVVSRALGTSVFAPSLSLALTLGVTLWALRLGGFLFRRVLHTGKDERLSPFFSESGEPILTGPAKYPLRLGGFWTLQGLWAWMCLLPVTAVQAVSPLSAPLPYMIIGGALFVSGLLLETVADTQKFNFKLDPSNRGKFIGDTGVYKYSQYPNYCGEMAVWLGVLISTGPKVWLAAPWTVMSPLFTILLLLKVSGIPLAEEKNERLYGKDPFYIAYKRNTSLLIPWPPKSNNH